jgi:hypothetical protein
VAPPHPRFSGCGLYSRTALCYNKAEPIETAESAENKKVKKEAQKGVC